MDIIADWVRFFICTFKLKCNKSSVNSFYFPGATRVGMGEAMMLMYIKLSATANLFSEVSFLSKQMDPYFEINI